MIKPELLREHRSLFLDPQHRQVDILQELFSTAHLISNFSMEILHASSSWALMEFYQDGIQEILLREKPTIRLHQHTLGLRLVMMLARIFSMLQISELEILTCSTKITCRCSQNPLQIPTFPLVIL